VHLSTDVLAEFNAPLVERVDVPEDAAAEGAVFIKRQQCTQAVRGEALE